MKKHHFYITFFLLLCIISKIYPQGLQFYGNEKRISERSSFCVYTDEYIPTATGKFSITFEYAAQNIESPGYIFYLKNTDGEEAFNLTYVYENSEGTLCLHRMENRFITPHSIPTVNCMESGCPSLWKWT